jgi:hypothetical protein
MENTMNDRAPQKQDEATSAASELNAGLGCSMATPKAVLLGQILNPNIAKNEREWAAAEEIKLLREEVTLLRRMVAWNEARRCEVMMAITLQMPNV